ncbi:MAG: hypothetical protein JO197_16610 [Acidobacteria bacterium]|nr:hypothetical protein [Acidobacteriota bacterium]MBV9475425.1 hypothetical protein [Acidobacteriota bacterium]
MIRLRSARLLLVFLAASCAWASSPLDPGMKAVEQIRGRKFLHPVRNVTIDRSELSAKLQEQMAQSVPYSLDEWGRILRALQLVDVEPKQLMPKLLSLYESQVLAFYDAQAHVYYSIKQLPKLPDGTQQLVDPEQLEEMVMVHELTHAIQDQHFGLSAKEKAYLKDSDAALAYHSVLEGEAVLVMLAHMLQKSGVDLDEIMKNDQMLAMLSSSAAAEQLIDPSTPKYFAEMLKFPYLEGLKFVVEAYRRGGWKALDAVHARPPLTTRQILHPDDYFAQTFKPESFDTSHPDGAISAEHLGEFHWRFLVGPDASRGWVNDRAVVYKDGRVDVTTKWESPERAAAFAEAYAAFLARRNVDAHVARAGNIVTAKYTAKS